MGGKISKSDFCIRILLLFLNGHTDSRWKFLGPGIKSDLQQTNSLIHGARPGVEPVSQGSQDIADPVAPKWELQPISVLEEEKNKCKVMWTIALLE